MAAYEYHLRQAELFDLPNELLIRILESSTTCSLLTFTIVSRRFYHLVIRIIHHRLLLAASLTDHKLILECYHPSSKNTEPYLFCDYLGTPGLGSTTQSKDILDGDTDGLDRLGELRGLYSRFRPIRPEVEEGIFRPHPAGDISGRVESKSSPSSSSPSSEPLLSALVKHHISLDSYELFSQLCVVANLVQLGPRRGVFYSFVNIADGVVRIWREWLAARAKTAHDLSSYEMCIGSVDGGILRGQDNELALNGKSAEENILWINPGKTVGIRIRIHERKWRHDGPILVHKDEEIAVSYVMEYEELLIRTTHLLLAVEQNLSQLSNISGKAMVFGAFASR